MVCLPNLLVAMPSPPCACGAITPAPAHPTCYFDLVCPHTPTPLPSPPCRRNLLLPLCCCVVLAFLVLLFCALLPILLVGWVLLPVTVVHLVYYSYLLLLGTSTLLPALFVDSPSCPHYLPVYACIIVVLLCTRYLCLCLPACPTTLSLMPLPEGKRAGGKKMCAPISRPFLYSHRHEPYPD